MITFFLFFLNTLYLLTDNLLTWCSKKKEKIDITYFLIGLLLGTIHNFSSWMFTATAGIFLYVALVDMMPELSSGHSHPISSNKQKEAHWLSLTLQV